MKTEEARKPSIGKIRGLEQIANPDGVFAICAMDHRGSLKRMIDPEHPERVNYDTVVEHKLELCSSLAPHASAVLLDPIFGAAQCIERGILPGNTGLLVSMEATGYSGDEEHRITELLPGWSVEKLRRMGASAVKILLYYRPDLEEEARRQRETVSSVSRECIKYDLPLLVEPKSYPVGNEVKNPEEFAKELPHLVIQTARELALLSIDVLKLEFPADLRYESDEGKLLDICHELSEASGLPWVILSAGVDYDLFYREVEIACRGGASGFLGGRAIWQEAMRIREAGERVQYLSTTAAERLDRLTEVATKYATPWYKKFGVSIQDLIQTSPQWYREY
jgi:tagatose 1,6-diphosphate aldolase